MSRLESILKDSILANTFQPRGLHRASHFAVVLVISLASLSCEKGTPPAQTLAVGVGTSTETLQPGKSSSGDSALVISSDNTSLSIMATSVISKGGNFQVSIKPLTEKPSLHELHAWSVQIFERHNHQELQPYSLSLSGGMQAHGHGLPTEPKLSHYQPGTGFIIEGVRFNMAGSWFLRAHFEHAGGNDSADIRVLLATDNLARDNLAEDNLAGPTVGLAADTNAADETKIVTQQQALLEWSESEIALLSSMTLNPERLTLNKTGNQVVESQAAAKLGQRLFFDQGFSRDGNISCATCHQPENYFTDGKPVAIGRSALTRNTPSVVGAATYRWLYWDGRRDSGWSQALVPFEAENEMGSSRVSVVSRINSQYRRDYEKLFGTLQPLSSALQTLTAENKNANPLGSELQRAAWVSMSAPVKHEINKVFSNTGKAIAAYEAQLLPKAGRFDYFVSALINKNPSLASQLLTLQEQRGLKHFISARTQCMNCHNGPLLSNQGFHNIGTGLSSNGNFDFGRMMGSQAVLMNEFNCHSQYSDDGERSCEELVHINRHEIPGMMRGAFRVPSLRGLARSAPFMHDGRFADLAAVIQHYIDPPAHVASSLHELPAINNFTAADQQALIAFLHTLGNEIDAPGYWQKPSQ